MLEALALAQGMNKTAKYDAKLIRNSPSGRTEADLPLKPILANQAPDPKLKTETYSSFQSAAANSGPTRA